MEAGTIPPTPRLFHYDHRRRRLWLGGQRWHHGLTGVILAAAGTMLMLHDWKDRYEWFRRGSGHSNH